MQVFRVLWSKVLVSIYLALTVTLSALSIAASRHMAAGRSSGIMIAVAFLLTACHTAIYLSMFTNESERSLPVVFAIGGVSILASIIMMAFCFDHDFLRCVFHASVALLLVFIFRRDRFPFMCNNRNSARICFSFLIVLEIAGLVWVIVHGYHGIILATPPTRHWIGFNIYTIGYIFLGLVAILYTRDFMFLRVRVSKQGFFIGDNDYTNLFGAHDLTVVSLFARSKDRRITCEQIAQAQISRENGRAPDCLTCKSDRHKATMCADYRRIYNQVLKIKKILETFAIGTILQPTNKMNITREGWKLELFQNVTLHSRNTEFDRSSTHGTSRNRALQ